MPNIKLNYLYRDVGNYKNFGSAIFCNNYDLSLDQIEMLVRSKLIDGEYFNANEWRLPDLYFQPWDDHLDHIFHELEGLEVTNEKITTNIDIKYWLNTLVQPCIAIPSQTLSLPFKSSH